VKSPLLAVGTERQHCALLAARVAFEVFRALQRIYPGPLIELRDARAVCYQEWHDAVGGVMYPPTLIEWAYKWNLQRFGTIEYARWLVIVWACHPAEAERLDVRELRLPEPEAAPLARRPGCTLEEYVRDATAQYREDTERLRDLDVLNVGIADLPRAAEWYVRREIIGDKLAVVAAESRVPQSKISTHVRIVAKRLTAEVLGFPNNSATSR
jgi:hypothetical protein